MKSYGSQAALRRGLLTGTSAVAMTLAASVAVAQEADSTDEVVVTGIRASLEKSLDIKRNAKGVVDAISAEEMGKFPDSNLAESLQRVSGVSIDRERGEGSRVTVRGWGPEYNLVTLNGRFMPTSTLGDGASAPSTRSFDFANLASEAVSGVEIYKTSKSAVPTGGIGSTINIKTTRPLEAPGFKATASFKLVNDGSLTDNIPDADGQHEMTALISNTWEDKLGVSLSLARQERQSAEAQASVGWRDAISESMGDQWGGIHNSWGRSADWSTNPPSGDTIYRTPQNMAYNLVNYSLNRTNGQLTMQYDIDETMRLTGDYTYSKYEIEARGNDVSIWFDHNGPTSTWGDGNPAPIISYVEDWNPEFGAAPTDLSMGASLTANQNENKSLGLNLAWDPNEKLSLEFDFHDSSAESTPNSPYGSNNTIGTASLAVRNQGINFENQIPVMSVTSWAGMDAFAPANRLMTGNAFRYAEFTNDTTQFQINGTYQADFTDYIDSIDFGVSVIEQDVRSAYGFTQNDSWGGLTTAADTPDDIFSTETLRDKFAGLQGSELIPESFSRVNFEKAANYIITDHDIENCGSDYSCIPAVLDTDRQINEKTSSVYVQLNSEFDIMDMPASLVAGLRYEQTEIDSASQVPNPDPDTARWVANNEFYWTADGTVTTSRQADFDYMLPALDFDVDVLEDVKIRLSYSETIARPTWADMQGGVALATLFRINEGAGSSGNPGLLPYESENLDFSTEWYYGDASYLSAGYYSKDVSNWISSNTSLYTSAEAMGQAGLIIPHPGIGGLAAEANTALGGGQQGADAIRGWIADNRASNPLVDTSGNAVAISGDVAANDDITWRITAPTNQENQSQTVDGFEIAWQHEFTGNIPFTDVSLDGFGLQANATIVDGDAEFDPLLNYTVSQFVLVGLSDSANLVAYYETDAFQARLAYNWRDAFVSGYGGGHVSNTEEYDQVDMHVSYDVSEGVNLFLDAINVTEESKRIHARDESYALFAAPGHARYYMGLRLTY